MSDVPSKEDPPPNDDVDADEKGEPEPDESGENMGA